jgi:hypothetical protein
MKAAEVKRAGTMMIMETVMVEMVAAENLEGENKDKKVILMYLLIPQQTCS